MKSISLKGELHLCYKKIRGSLINKNIFRVLKYVLQIQSYKFSLITVLVIFIYFNPTVMSASLEILKTNPLPTLKKERVKPGQLPHSKISTGNNNIKSVWYSGSTNSYRHGVLGDSLEATKLNVLSERGKILTLTLPLKRVFEDLQPRLVDFNKDKKDEIVVIETDQNFGASLAVYAIEKGNLVKITSTNFLGSPNRWLNPLGFGDFDGDGKMDIALVATPHIGGILRFYRFNKGILIPFAEYFGISTHQIGSTELGLGRVIHRSSRDLILAPDQSKRVMKLLEWRAGSIHEIAKVRLPGRVTSSLIRIKRNSWNLSLDNGYFYEILVKK